MPQDLRQPKSAELTAVNEMLAAVSLSSMSLEEQRRAVEVDSGLPSTFTVDLVTMGGVDCEWIVATGSHTSRTILAFRGGGYCLGSLASNRRFSGLLSEYGDAAVLNIGFRNAPEHRYPAALADCLAVINALESNGFDISSTGFAGNSAGGGLMLATMLARRDRGDPLPSCAVALSPWTDLTNSGASIKTNADSEQMLDPTGIHETAALYAGLAELADPYVSPLHGDLAGLPPILLHASAAEILLDDTVRFASKAAAHGVDVTVEIQPHVPHVWHLFEGLLPEADLAMTSVGLWLLDRLGTTRRHTPA